MSTPVEPERASRVEPERAPRRKRPSQARISIFAFLYGAFAAGALYFGVLFLTNISQISRAGGDIVQTITTIPQQVIQVTEPNRAPRIEDRYTVLIVGNDARPGEDRRLIRTDSMMLLTMDPINQEAAILSIPRDLYVPIPVGTGNSREVITTRINEAWQLGYLRNYPGGGAALMKRTVEYNFGVRVDNFVMVDFTGFERAVDTLGGIEIDVPYRIVDTEYPTMDYGYKTIRFEPGRQVLNGERALIYARTRHQDSDFGRTKRQQQIVLAMRDKALQINILPRLPQLFADLTSTIETDISLPDALNLARVAREIPRESILTHNLDGNATIDANVGGAAVLMPNRTEIAKIVSELFYDPKVKQEAARVQISNATQVRGLAQRSADLLAPHPFGQVMVVNAEEPASQSSIVVYSGKRHSAEQIARLLNIPANRIQERRTPNAPVDIEVVIGADARLPQVEAR